MAFTGLDHVVIRVKNLDAAVEGYKKIFGTEPKRATSSALKAAQAFFYFGNGTFLELIQPTDDSSPIAGSLNKLGEGVHTVAFATDNVAATVKELSDKAVRTVGGAFVHPASANGVLLQLSEKK
jgi:methylmalonyl-CoA epimerase